MPPPAHTPAAGPSTSTLTASSPSLAAAPPSAASPPRLPPALVPQVDSLERILEDLQSYQIPQLGDCRGPKSLFDQLTQQVRQELARCRRDLDELKLDADDLARARDRDDANWHVDQLQLFLDQCTKAYRSAVVQAKRVIDSSQHYLNREELLASSGRDSPAPAASPSGEDALMSATSDVTEGLRRTLQLLQSEVDRSQVSNELLEQQTQTMASTTTQYSTLSSLLTTSKHLITSLERADILDRLVLFGAFSFFVAVCSYIFKKRVVDRGLKVASAVSGVLGRGGTKGDAKELVKQEFRGELEKVAMATAAVVGAVRKAKEMVGEKIDARRVPTQHKREEEDEGEQHGNGDAERIRVSDRIVEHAQRPTAEPVTSSSRPEYTAVPVSIEPSTLSSAFTTGTTDSAFDPPTPTAAVDQDPASKEEELEWLEADDAGEETATASDPVPEKEAEEAAEGEDADAEVQVEEDDDESEDAAPEEVFDNAAQLDSESQLAAVTSSASATVATAPPDPTLNAAYPTDPDAEIEAYSPDPTQEPSATQFESNSEASARAETEPSDDTSSIPESSVQAAAEPELEIAAPSTPPPSDADVEPSMLLAPRSAIHDAHDEPEPIEPVNLRPTHPPTPSHTREELEAMFDHVPSISSSVTFVDHDEAGESGGVIDPSSATTDEPVATTIGLSRPSPSALDLVVEDEPHRHPELEHTTTPLDTSRDAEDPVGPETIPRLVFEEGDDGPAAVHVALPTELLGEAEDRDDDDDDVESDVGGGVVEPAMTRRDRIGRDGEGRIEGLEEGEPDAASGSALLDKMMERQMAWNRERVGAGLGNDSRTSGSEAEDDRNGDSVAQEAEAHKPFEREGTQLELETLADRDEFGEANTADEVRDEGLFDSFDPTTTQNELGPEAEAVPEATPDLSVTLEHSVSPNLATESTAPTIVPELAETAPIPTASIVYEAIPSPPTLEDIVVEQPDLLAFSPEDLAFDVNHDDQITEPVAASIEHEDEQEDKGEEREVQEPTQVDLPIPTASPSLELKGEQSPSRLPPAAPIPSASGSEMDAARFAQETEENGEEEPSSIEAAPNPAPAPSPGAGAESHLISKEETAGDDGVTEEDNEQILDPPIPQPEPTPSLVADALLTPAPESVVSAVRTSTTPGPAAVSARDPPADGDVSSTDAIPLPTVDDLPPSFDRTGEEYDSVFTDVEEAGTEASEGKAGDEPKYFEGSDDDEHDDNEAEPSPPHVAEDPSVVSHVEL